MTPTRVALIVLVILAVFFLVLLWSVEGDDQSYESPGDFRRNFRPPSWSRTAFRLLGPFSPRLELQQRTILVDAGKTSKEILVSRSDWPFRRAAWVLRSGEKAWVRYQVESEIEDLRNQELELTGPDQEPQSLAVLASGGEIRISCQGDLKCRVELVD